MGREEMEQAGIAVDAEGLHLVGQAARLDRAETRERGDHGPGRAEQARRAGVRAELAPAREPGDDQAREDAEQDLRDDHGDVEVGTDAALGAEYRLVDD